MLILVTSINNSKKKWKKELKHFIKHRPSFLLPISLSHSLSISVFRLRYMIFFFANSRFSLMFFILNASTDQHRENATFAYLSVYKRQNTQKLWVFFPLSRKEWQCVSKTLAWPMCWSKKWKISVDRAMFKS